MNDLRAALEQIREICERVLTMPEASNAQVATYEGILHDVLEKSGRKQNGKAWRLYEVYIGDSVQADRYATFSESLGAQASNAKGKRVRISYTRNDRGATLQSLEVLPADEWIECVPLGAEHKNHNGRAWSILSCDKQLDAILWSGDSAVVADWCAASDKGQCIAARIGPLRKGFREVQQLRTS